MNTSKLIKYDDALQIVEDVLVMMIEGYDADLRCDYALTDAREYEDSWSIEDVGKTFEWWGERTVAAKPTLLSAAYIGACCCTAQVGREAMATLGKLVLPAVKRKKYGVVSTRNPNAKPKPRGRKKGKHQGKEKASKKPWYRGGGIFK